MVARRTGHVSRAAAGLRAPRSVSRNITPARGGVGVHYGGPAQRLTSHAQCIARWKFWQDFHMSPGWAGTSNGGADIAYNFGFCDHGYTFAGRGLGVRSAGNGTNAGNQNFYAAVWLGGEGERPSSAALDALEWIILECRNNGAGAQVRPHSWFKSTACCGNPLRAHLPNVHNKTIGASTVPVVPDPEPTTPDMEAFLMSIPEEEARFLRRLAQQAIIEDLDGQSFARQQRIFYDQERPFLQGLIDGVKKMRVDNNGHPEPNLDLQAAASSTMRAALAVWRESQARGWTRSFAKFRVNRVYTKNDLE
jgi:hypothetical protein